VTLDGNAFAGDESGLDIVALDDALSELAAADARTGQIVELRFLTGMTIEEVAETLDVSPTTVKEEWRTARAWLRRKLEA
jgi:RNA polymerase sigma factor (sigma-70 family)